MNIFGSNITELQLYNKLIKLSYKTSRIVFEQAMVK